MTAQTTNPTIPQNNLPRSESQRRLGRTMSAKVHHPIKARNSREAIHRAMWIIALASLFLLAANVNGQTVAPIGGLGNIQFFDNNGAVLTNGVLYSFQAGTSVQQATYTDSSGLIQNPNPIPFGSGARVQIWLSIGSFYKLVLCSQNDGAACAAGDILFTVDQVPGGSTSSGGTSSSPFISGTASPATSGILRLATSDSICWRNAAGSTNLCMSKDANDLLSWAGGSLKLPEVGAPSCPGGFDVLFADNTLHRFRECINGSGPFSLAAGGVALDINDLSQIVQWHFGATPTPLSGTAPTTNQLLQWNGSAIAGVGSTPEFIVQDVQILTGSQPVCNTSSAANSCAIVVLANAHTLTRLTFTITGTPTACGTPAAVGVKDLTSSTVLTSIAPANGTATGLVDSGALSIAMTAGHTFGVGIVTTSAGCGNQLNAANATMNYN